MTKEQTKITADDLTNRSYHVKCGCGNVTTFAYSWRINGQDLCPKCVVEKLKASIHKLTRR